MLKINLYLTILNLQSYQMFDNWPNAGWNPNLNPICGTKIRATARQDDGSAKSVVVSIVDRSVDYFIIGFGGADMI